MSTSKIAYSTLTNKNVRKFASTLEYKIFNNKNVKTFVDNLSKDGSLLPVVLLEASVIAGRTYHANKRGGNVEARERFREESLAAVIWLWGMKTFNTAYDFAAKKLGLKHIGIDIGKDSSRNPAAKFFKENPKIKKLPYSIAKFAKPVLSAGMTIWMVGDVIPKYIHKMTDKRIQQEASEMNKAYEKLQQKENNTNNTQGNNFLGHTSLRAQQRTSIEEFLQNARKKAVSFTSMSGVIKGMTTLAYNLENKPIYQLLTVDTGLVSGRATNARNSDERREIIFRDGASAIFYSLSTPIIAKALALFDPFGAKNTNLDPKTVEIVHNYLLKNINFDDLEEGKIDVDKFKTKILGEKRNKASEIIRKIEADITKGKSGKEASKALKQYSVSLKEFEAILSKQLPKEEVKIIMEEAMKMSKLQPEHFELGKILSKTQIEDVLTKGLINKAEFLQEALEKALKTPKIIKFLSKENKETLTNPNRFISQNKIDAARGYIDDYIKSIIEAANTKNGHKVDKNLLDYMKIRNVKYKFIYTIAGMGVSAAFLSFVIPKLQYLMTEKRTGENTFPGVKNYSA